MAQESMSVTVRLSDGTMKEITEVPREITVLGFKRRIEGKVGCPSSRHRLIYRGRLLTDDRETLASCGVLDGHTIHFVKGGPPTAATSPAHSPPAASSSASFPPPDAMRGMMESPMMQSMMQNPDLMRSLVESNPQLRALADANPELRHALSDPELMRQAMQSARDPYAMRQQQRSQELAISQLENHPGGFQHLRRMYEQVQAPMEEAALTSGLGALSDESTSGSSPSSQQGPLPNPWGTAPPLQQPAQQHMSPFSSPMSGFPPMGNSPEMFQALAANPALFQQAMDSPMMAQMMAGPPQTPQQQPAHHQPGMPSSNARNEPSANYDLASLFGQMGAATLTPPQPPAGTPGSPSAPPLPPSYAALEEQLHAMGFVDRPANQAALAASGGNLNAAVEWLLSRQP